MRRNNLILLAAAWTVSTLLGACSTDQDPPQSELDRFVASHQELPTNEAIEALYLKVQEPAPASSYARYQLGNIFYTMANDSARTRGWNDDFARSYLDSAEAWFESTIAADSTFVEAYVNLGAVWDDRADMMATRPEREARIGNARIMYEKALELRPEDDKARCNLGALFKRQNNLERAMQEFLTALEYNPRSALAHYNLAILFATMRIYREALLEFELAVKYDPDGDIGERSRDNIKIIKDLMAGELDRAVRVN